MSDWNISDKAAQLHQNALVWDMSLSWENDFEPKQGTLERFVKSGFDFISLTVGGDRYRLDETVKQIAAVTTEIRGRSDQVLVRKADDILQAKRDGKLALCFNLQGTNGLDGDINMVQWASISVIRTLF